MRPQKILDKEILQGLTNVFRSKGYEGASLTDLSEATGLKKASLYHRFPNGKQEMAEAVLTYLNEWVGENIFRVLLDENIEPKERLKKGLLQINTLYNGGKETCIFRSLSMELGIELFENQIKSGMREWISVFSKVGVELGLSIEEAKKSALQVLIEIQGSLIVSKGLKDVTVFKGAIENIEKKYLK